MGLQLPSRPQKQLSDMAYCEANLISPLHKDVCIICLQIKLKVEENVETNFTFFFFFF